MRRSLSKSTPVIRAKFVWGNRPGGAPNGHQVAPLTDFRRTPSVIRARTFPASTQALAHNPLSAAQFLT